MIGENLSGVWKFVVPILLFPVFFQDKFLSFAWGTGDDLLSASAKRVFLLLPSLSIVFSCWVSVFCGLSLIVRPHRSKFLSTFFLTWLDLGKAIFAFWGGIVKFLFYLVGWVLGFIKIIFVGVIVALLDLILVPFRLLAGVGHDYLRPGIPWIAIFVTFGWCLLEAFIFTIVVTPLVMDVFSNMTGEVFSVTAIRIPLFLMLLSFVLGSYAVLSTWVEAFKTKDVGKIIQIGIFEVFVLFFEVFFLYREFVDALVPWFAQHAGENFELGIFGTLLIACFAWLGVRGMSWFLFAAHGTPSIMAIIARTGLKVDLSVPPNQESQRYVIGQTFIHQLKKEIEWIHQKGDEFLGAFILPPLQILAGSVNFCSLLVTSNHLFHIPFRHISELRDSRSIIQEMTQKS